MDHRTAALVQAHEALARAILTLTDLAEPDWDTYALVAEVDVGRCSVTGYRYTEAGPPRPCRPPDVYDIVTTLREATRGDDGQAWDVMVVKVHRDTADLVMTFHSGAEAAPLRVRPENLDAIREARRPRPEDFGPGDLDPGLTVADEIARVVFAMDELAGEDWDSFAAAAEVDDGRSAITAYRYTDGGPPVPTEEPDIDDILWDLRQVAMATGEGWDVAIVTARRTTGTVEMRYLSGSAAAMFRIRPANMTHLPESLRPPST